MVTRKKRKAKASGRRLLRLDGQSYFHIVGAMRTQCELTAVARLPRLGKKAPKAFEHLGRMLALLDQMASCAWGCPGTEDGHVVHRLVGRGVSNAKAATDLALGGQYDESLALARGVGELANLLWLFCVDRQAMGNWRTLDSKARWRSYRPVEVRRSLERLGQPILVKEHEYGLLSEHGIHVNPGTAPHSLGTHQQPTLGGVYREDALIVCLNEIAWAVGVLSLPSVRLLGPAQDASFVLKSAKALLSNVGGLRVTEVADFWRVHRQMQGAG